MVRRVAFPSLLLLALVAALVGFARPAAAAIGPPWCGTPEPDAAEALPSTGTSFPHIPVYAIGCTLADIQSRSLDGRMSLSVHGTSATGRPLYKVVINQLRTEAQQASFDHWTTLRRQALSNPAAAQRQLRGWRDRVKVPIFIQGAIHGNEYEGVDANMRTIERLATTPYGTDPEVDAILDGAVVIFNVIQNPDGRVVGQRPNGNGFDLNRDFLTQSQSETKASVRIMQEWLPPETLDLHGYVTPTLIEATTKPHNPGIDYDLWLKWNQSRIDANEAAMNAVNLNVTRPINDWCSDGSISVQGGPVPGRPACRSGGRRELGRLGPVLHADVLAARRPERLDGRDVQQHEHVGEPAQPLLPERRPGSGEEPDRAERIAAGAADGELVDAPLRHGQPERAPATTSSRSTAAASRARHAPRAARRRSTSRTTGCTSSRPRT